MFVSFVFSLLLGVSLFVFATKVTARSFVYSIARYFPRNLPGAEKVGEERVESGLLSIRMIL